MNNSFLFDAGWVFFAAWSVALVLVNVKAFGRDFFPSKTSQTAPGKSANRANVMPRV